MMTGIAPAEFKLMQEYIEGSCGIHISSEKSYLFEARLTILMAENGCTSYRALRDKARADGSGQLHHRIIDSMTTNETFWFRDQAPYRLMESLFASNEQIRWSYEKNRSLSVWSVACSTGQEPYSIAMTLCELARKGNRLDPSKVSILATDISRSALFIARTARYDTIAMSRGMTPDIRDRYFRPQGPVWELSDQVKKMVTLKHHNLKEDTAMLGTFDLIFCRNVLIYFSDALKRLLLEQLSRQLRTEGILVVGASEAVMNYSDLFDLHQHDAALYYRLKKNKN